MRVVHEDLEANDLAAFGIQNITGGRPEREGEPVLACLEKRRPGPATCRFLVALAPAAALLQHREADHARSADGDVSLQGVPAVPVGRNIGGRERGPRTAAE